MKPSPFPVILTAGQIHIIELVLKSTHQIISDDI